MVSIVWRLWWRVHLLNFNFWLGLKMNTYGLFTTTFIWNLIMVNVPVVSIIRSGDRWLARCKRLLPQNVLIIMSLFEHDAHPLVLKVLGCQTRRHDSNSCHQRKLLPFREHGQPPDIRRRTIFQMTLIKGACRAPSLNKRPIYRMTLFEVYRSGSNHRQQIMQSFVKCVTASI